MPKEQTEYSQGSLSDRTAAAVRDSYEEQSKTARARSTMESNRAVPFINRMYNPDLAGSRKNPDGSVSSHLLATAGVGNRTAVYPALQWLDNKWVENENPTSALDLNNIVFFDDPAKAEEFAAGSWKGVKP